MSDAPIQFYIPGVPAPGGSKRGFAIRKGGVLTGRVALIDAGGERTRNWRQVCSVCAQAVRPAELLRGPLRVNFFFVMPRPKYHFHTSKAKKGQLREDAPKYHTSKPDMTKLIRSTEDSCTGILWFDDAQIVEGLSQKHFGDAPGCHIEVWPL